MATLPEGATFSDEEIRGAFASTSTRSIVNGQPIEFIVGKKWEPIAIDPSPVGAFDDARLVAFWAPPKPTGAGRPTLQIFHCTLRRDISAAHWLVCFATAHDYDVRELEPISAAVADSLVSYTIDADTFVGRLTVRLFGTHAVVALASDLADNYSAMAEVLALMVRGVSVPGQVPAAQVEVLQLARLPACRLRLPASWVPEVLADTGDGRAAINFSQMVDGVPAARLRIKSMPIVQPSAIDQSIARTLEEYKRAGLNLADPPDNSAAIELAAPFTVARHLRYHATASGADPLELRVMAIEAPGRLLCISLLSPDAKSALYEYAVSNRALAILLDSLTLDSGPSG